VLSTGYVAMLWQANSQPEVPYRSPQRVLLVRYVLGLLSTASASKLQNRRRFHDSDQSLSYGKCGRHERSAVCPRRTAKSTCVPRR
jgi:hypothetical protein